MILHRDSRYLTFGGEGNRSRRERQSQHSPPRLFVCLYTAQAEACWDNHRRHGRLRSLLSSAHPLGVDLVSVWPNAWMPDLCTTVPAGASEHAVVGICCIIAAVSSNQHRHQELASRLPLLFAAQHDDSLKPLLLVGAGSTPCMRRWSMALFRPRPARFGHI